MATYTSLEQRMAHTYLDMLPPFVPLADGPVSVHAQEQFYGFMQQVYQALHATPELFFKTLREDDAYPNRYNRTPYGKPKLHVHMKRDITEIEDLLTLLWSLGQNGTVDGHKLVLSEAVEIKKKRASVLPHLGLQLDGRVLTCDQADDPFPAWRWMATRPHATALAFARCLFDPAYPYMPAIYARLFGDPQAFGALEQYLAQRGYARVDTQRGPYTMDYIKQRGTGAAPLGDPKYGDPHHYGISAEYNYGAAVPQYLVLRILDMRAMLHRFAQMPEDLQGFITRTAKKCDHCRYCTQTDKTGQRKPLAVDVSYDRDYSLCPLYPGASFTFEALSPELVSNLMAFLDFMDAHLSSG